MSKSSLCSSPSIHLRLESEDLFGDVLSTLLPQQQPAKIRERALSGREILQPREVGRARARQVSARRRRLAEATLKSKRQLHLSKDVESMFNTC